MTLFSECIAIIKWHMTLLLQNLSSLFLSDHLLIYRVQLRWASRCPLFLGLCLFFLPYPFAQPPGSQLPDQGAILDGQSFCKERTYNTNNPVISPECLSAQWCEAKWSPPLQEGEWGGMKGMEVPKTPCCLGNIFPNDDLLLFFLLCAMTGSSTFECLLIPFLARNTAGCWRHKLQKTVCSSRKWLQRRDPLKQAHLQDFVQATHYLG